MTDSLRLGRRIKVQVINKEFITAIDVDGTLIKTGTLEPIQVHIDFLRLQKRRGHTILVWSMNGWEHAETVIKHLKLEDQVDYIMSKPIKHVDDCSNVADIIGNRIFLAKEEK